MTRREAFVVGAAGGLSVAALIAVLGTLAGVVVGRVQDRMDRERRG